MTGDELRQQVNAIVKRSLGTKPLEPSDIDMLICYIDLLEYKLSRVQEVLSLAHNSQQQGQILVATQVENVLKSDKS